MNPVVYTYQSGSFARVEIFNNAVWSTPCKKCGNLPKPREGWSMSCVFGTGTNHQHDQGIADVKTVLTGDAARQYIANM